MPTPRLWEEQGVAMVDLRSFHALQPSGQRTKQDVEDMTILDTGLVHG